MKKSEIHIPVSSDVDANMRYRPNELMNYLADLAGRHASETGFGYHDMQEKGLFWVLHQFRISIERPPMLGEQLECITQPWFRKGLKADRQFLVQNGADELLKAHTVWLLIDINTKRPLPLSRHFTEMGEALFPEANLPGMNGLEKGPVAGDHTVAWSDVDMHRHCNNSRYMSWSLDLLPMEIWEQHYPSDFQINFHKESFAGENIILHMNNAGENYRFDGMRGDDPIFTLRMKMGLNVG